ncbi:hypothetical protein [Aureibacter tunicatorum]|uniref:Uncharacterized protein n=1 Tax=Aureibacter tunicatorum TaxID=866807 RepID=A0AAE3XM81_9BACT|nr:hypothetical protein [Aureibacter tunicatorum]MDR6240486.1 hypothetical protein [Aureibacter tunicatorum]
MTKKYQVTSKKSDISKYRKKVVQRVQATSNGHFIHYYSEGKELNRVIFFAKKSMEDPVLNQTISLYQKKGYKTAIKYLQEQGADDYQLFFTGMNFFMKKHFNDSKKYLLQYKGEELAYLRDLILTDIIYETSFRVKGKGNSVVPVYLDVLEKHDDIEHYAEVVKNRIKMANYNL